MPYQEVTGDLGNAAEQTLVRVGQRINSLTIEEAPRGISYQLRIGNNPWLTLTGKPAFRLRAPLPVGDTSQGVFFKPTIVIPNAIVRIFIGYT